VQCFTVYNYKIEQNGALQLNFQSIDDHAPSTRIQ